MFSFKRTRAISVIISPQERGENASVLVTSRIHLVILSIHSVHGNREVVTSHVHLVILSIHSPGRIVFLINPFAIFKFLLLLAKAQPSPLFSQIIKSSCL